MYIWQRPEWPNFRWNINKLTEQLGRTRFCQGHLISQIGSLGFRLSEEARAEILVEEAVKTSAVEGATLNMDAVRSSVARHLGLPVAGLPSPDRYVDGLVEVLLDATLHYDRPFTAKRLMGWQAALFPTGFSGIHRIRVGAWRGPEPMRIVSGPVGHERIHFEAPPHGRIPAEIKRFLLWWSKSRGKIDGLLRAGIAHFYFVTVHPFEDGNGRIARALTDMALAQDEKLERRFYSLSSHIMAERDAYYKTLESSSKGGLDITEWLLWFLGCTERAILNTENIISRILAKAEFWQHHTDTPMTKHQRKVVNRLLDAGPDGFEGGLTTRKYVSLAKVSRATAYREISDLVTKGILEARGGKGRNVSYGLRKIKNGQGTIKKIIG